MGKRKPAPGKPRAGGGIKYDVPGGRLCKLLAIQFRGGFCDVFPRLASPGLVICPGLGLAFPCRLCYSGGGQMAGSNRLRWALDSRLLVQGWAAIFFTALEWHPG